MKFQPLKNLFAHFCAPSIVESLCKESFDNGRRLGHEEGMKDVRVNQIMESAELTPEQEEELFRFLMDRNLSLCYDSRINGMRVRKRDYRLEAIQLQFTK